MARSWTGIRRPTERAALRRLEKGRDAPAEWWRKWNELDGGRWAQEKVDEDVKARRLLEVLMTPSKEAEDEAKGIMKLAEALGLNLKNGGEQ